MLGTHRLAMLAAAGLIAIATAIATPARATFGLARPIGLESRAVPIARPSPAALRLLPEEDRRDLTDGRDLRDRTAENRASRSAPPGDRAWAALAHCESNGNPQAQSRDGRYHGAFQFSLDTWHRLGLAGSPSDASFADQLAAAKRLQARSGWAQWPGCARRLGLL